MAENKRSFREQKTRLHRRWSPKESYEGIRGAKIRLRFDLFSRLISSWQYLIDNHSLINHTRKRCYLILLDLTKRIYAITCLFLKKRKRGKISRYVEENQFVKFIVTAIRTRNIIISLIARCSNVKSSQWRWMIILATDRERIHGRAR